MTTRHAIPIQHIGAARPDKREIIGKTAARETDRKRDNADLGRYRENGDQRKNDGMRRELDDLGQPTSSSPMCRANATCTPTTILDRDPGEQHGASPCAGRPEFPGIAIRLGRARRSGRGQRACESDIAGASPRMLKKSSRCMSREQARWFNSRGEGLCPCPGQSLWWRCPSSPRQRCRHSFR